MSRVVVGDKSSSGALSPHPLPGPSFASPPMGMPPARPFPTPLEFLNALRRRWVLAGLLGGLVGAVFAVGVWMALPTGKHEVRAMIQVRPASSILGKGTTDQDFDSFKQNQAILIRTRFLLTRVLARPKVAELPFVRNSDDPVRYLEDNLTIRWQSPEIMSVSMNGDDPKQLQVILDTLMSEYLDDTRSDEARSRDTKMKSLEASKTDLSKRIAAIEANLQKLQSLGGELGPSPQTTAVMVNLYTQELSRLVTELAKLQTTARTLEAKCAETERELKKIDDAPVDPDAIHKVAETDPRVQVKAAQLTQAHVELKKDEGKLAPNNPLLGKLKRQVEAAERELQKVLDDIQPEYMAAARANLRKECLGKLDDCQTQLKTVQQDIAHDENQRKQLTDRIFAANRAGLNGYLEMDELKALREKRDTINRELLQLDFERRVDSRVQLREEAVVILNQNLKKKLIMAAGAGFAGCVGMILVVGFLEWRTRRVDSVDQVVSELSMRVIGTIPAFPSRSAISSGDAAQDQAWRFVLNESVNSARTMLLHAARANSMQILLVTSAAQSEGKTSLASQLATSLAAAGLRTLLLDGDLRNPSMHKLFDTPLGPGCSEVLTQELDVSEVILPTMIPNLWLIPAGQYSYRAMAALAQGHPVEFMFNRLRGQFDFVIVDSCPILPVADALLLGQHVDGAILSVMEGSSQLPKVRTAAEKLVLLSIPLLGAVINGVKPDLRNHTYTMMQQLPA